MGQTRQITCNGCGHRWERTDGRGFSYAYFCDSFDKEKTLYQDVEKTKSFLDPTNLGLCECWWHLFCECYNPMSEMQKH